MGQARVFEYAWPKASILPWCHLTSHFGQSTQSLPMCTLFSAFVHRQPPHTGAALPGRPQELGHSSCLGHQGTNRQQQRSRVLRKSNEYVSSFQRAFLKEQRYWMHRRCFTLHSKALIWERRVDRQHCMYCKGPHSWKQGKRSKRPLQSQQGRLFISLFALSDLNA